MKQLPVMKSETFKDLEHQSAAMAFIQVYKGLNDIGKKNLITYVENCLQFDCYQLGYDSSIDDKEERLLNINIILERIEEQRADKRRQENIENYKELFDILAHQPIGVILSNEVKAIHDKYLMGEQLIWFAQNLYQWGYIQGKRAERARRKQSVKKRQRKVTAINV